MQAPYKEISAEELVELMRKGAVVVYDVRTREQYERSHIKGARWLPVSQIDNNKDEIPKDREIVVYCTNVRCTASHMAAVKLSELGFKVYRFTGGLEEWASKGYPVESGPARETS